MSSLDGALVVRVDVEHRVVAPEEVSYLPEDRPGPR